MVRRRGQIRTDQPAHRPSQVEITVTVERRRRRRRGGASPVAGVVIAAAVLVGVPGVVISSAPHHNPRGIQTSTRAAQAQRADTAGVAAAYGYPARCLRVTTSASDPTAASARVARTGSCARYRGYVDASFHWIDGGWRLVLDEGQLFVPNNLLAPGR